MNRKQRKRQLERRRAHAAPRSQPRNVLGRATYPTVKQGHVVPATYQRNFAVDERVAVHVPGRAAHVELHVTQAGTRSRFYRRVRPDGTEIDDVEAMLGVLEDVGPVLVEMANGARLTEERKGVLCQFLGMQMLRGPAFFSQHRFNVTELISESLTPSNVAPQLLSRTGGDMEVAKQEVIAKLTDSTRSLMTMRTLGLKVSSILGSMRWRLLRFDDPLLAYSDQPVVVWPAEVRRFDRAPAKPTFGPLGAVEVRAPLSPTLAVLMTWPDEPDIEAPVHAEARYAAELNAMVIGQADKQWMHRPGPEPPMAQGPLYPLSRAFEPGYTAASLDVSRRRVAGGIAAPGSLGSRRDSLPSPGSSHQLVSTSGPTTACLEQSTRKAVQAAPGTISSPRCRSRRRDGLAGGRPT